MNSRYLILAAVLLLSASCDKQALQGGGCGLPMQLEASLAGDTKGSLATADLTDFYLQVSAADPAFSYFEHASKDGSGAWTTPSRLYWKDEDTPVSYAAARFGAHAFTAAEFDDGVDLELPKDQSTQERLNAADLLTMPASSKTYEDTTDGTLPVTLAHALSTVTFTLTLGPDFYDNFFTRTVNPVKDFAVSGTNLGFNFKPKTGVVSVAADTKADIAPHPGAFTPGTSESKSATAAYEAILVPQTLAAGALKVTFHVGAYDYEWSNADAVTLAAGKTYDLAVSATTAPPVIQPVNLGLPSGLLWASCNLGADSPEESGDYFPWSDVASKTFYGSWRLPTKLEMEELVNNTTFSWTTVKGVSGGLFTASNGSSIFLPAAGYYNAAANTSMGTDAGYYWSSTEESGEMALASGMTIHSSGCGIDDTNKKYGFLVRLVKAK